MSSVDHDIYELEQRLHRREGAIRHTAAEARTRAMKTLVSPVSLLGALALGFLVASAVGRRRAPAPAPAREPAAPAAAKGLGIGSLAMAGASWFIRSQFGGPVGLAHFVVDKVRGRAGAQAEAEGPPPRAASSTVPASLP